MQSNISAVNARQYSDTGKSAAEQLVVKVGAKKRGINILKMQEIRGYKAVTTSANAPDFIKGTINLRSVITPVVDMRIIFNLGRPMHANSKSSSS